MPDQKPAQQDYLLGQQHLLKQGQMLNPFTRRLLVDAGISSGMRVLDVGCGAGDVSLLAGELVGETGSVLGVDTKTTVLELAGARAQAAGMKQVTFQGGDIRDMSLDGPYDAIVGRLILMHLHTPADLLRRLAMHVRGGGVLAFQEYDVASYAQGCYPPAALWEQAVGWIVRAFALAGIELSMGMKFHGTFLDAGLPAPYLCYEAPMGAGPEWVGYEVLAETVRSILPLIGKLGVATEEEIGIDTLAERLRQAVVSQSGVARFPALVAAWARTSGA